MKNGSHLEVVASIKDMNTDLNREFEVGSEDYNQASRGFCSSKTSNLLRVVTLYTLVNYHLPRIMCLNFGPRFFSDTSQRSNLLISEDI